MTQKEKDQPKLKNVSTDAFHVGGISNQLGGVDPEIDQDLIRLAGGP